MRIIGLDRLRGLGIFVVIVLHTAFYHFSGIYDVDLSNPSLIITLIGFLLMFAGLFAMISGAAYALQYLKKGKDFSKDRQKGMLKTAFALLVVAYLYFLITGPGLIDFASRSMDESLFVGIINQGKFSVPSQERLFYVDSLVMLSLNVFLLALFFKSVGKRMFHANFDKVVLATAFLFLAISYIRIPLYNVYLNAVDAQNYGSMILLNFFVNKNNPIFPFFAFALFGVWWAMNTRKRAGFSYRVAAVGCVLLVVGVAGYIFTPETMLERAIDPSWYFIMVMQNGLFLIMIEAVKQYWSKPSGVVSRFFERFGIAGLTPFFIESTVSALVFKLLFGSFGVTLTIPMALLFGLGMAASYGVLLVFWEKKNYAYGVEWAMISLVKRKDESTKFKRMNNRDSTK